MDHVRRKFFELTVSGAAPIAEEMLRRIGELYDVEASIRGSPPEAWLRVRQEQARPKVEALRQWLERELARLPGKSTTAQAIRYALSRWTAPCRYLNGSTIDIDNNATERSIRPVATRCSFYTPFLTIWKHWKLTVGGRATRALCAFQGCRDTPILQV
jgi:transposase